MNSVSKEKKKNQKIKSWQLTQKQLDLLIKKPIWFAKDLQEYNLLCLSALVNYVNPHSHRCAQFLIISEIVKQAPGVSNVHKHSRATRDGNKC